MILPLCLRASVANFEADLAGEKNGVDHVDHAIGLIDVRDRDLRGAALLIGEDDVLALHADPEFAAAHGIEFRFAAAVLDGFGDFLAAQTPRGWMRAGFKYFQICKWRPQMTHFCCQPNREADVSKSCCSCNSSSIHSRRSGLELSLCSAKID